MSLSALTVTVVSDSLTVSSGNWKGRSVKERRAFSAAELRMKEIKTNQTTT